MQLCPVCLGRGEVEAGITEGDGKEATKVFVNPNAYDRKNKTVWFLDINPLCILWSTSLCMICRGVGFVGA